MTTDAGSIDPARDANRDRKFWDGQASRYDRLVLRIGSNYGRMLELLQGSLPRQGTILEAATGTGNIALHLGDHSRMVFASDSSVKMIQQAHQKGLETGAPGVEFQVQDAFHLGFPDQTFDAVICANTLHVVQDPLLLLAELVRVAKPGAVLYLPTYMHRQHLQAFALSHFFRIFGFHVYNRFDQNDFRLLLEKAGLSDIEIQLLPGLLFPIAYATAIRPPNS